MNDQKIFELYEKLYFHEVEAREKISIRLQIPLAILLSIISVYALLIKGIAIENHSAWNFIFFLFFLFSIIPFSVSVAYFVRSFYGHTYEFLPPAIKTEQYRKKLAETYKGYDDYELLVTQYFNEYLFNYYNECSSANTKVNDKRSEFLHKCITYLILAALPLTISFLIFTLSGIDKNSVDKEYKIKIVNSLSINKDIFPVELKGEFKSGIIEIDFSENLKKYIKETEQSFALKKNPTIKDKGQDIRVTGKLQKSKTD